MSSIVIIFFFLFTASNGRGCIQVTNREVKLLVETMVKSQVKLAWNR